MIRIVGEDSDSDEEELHFIDVDNLLGTADVFTYDDPLLVTGILRAVVDQDLMKVKGLVGEGHSININDNNGNTPLHVAVIKNLENIVDYLLAQEDIVVNIRNFGGETPLFHAVKANHLVIVKKLIRAGANVNLPNHEDVTPLHLAVKRNPELSNLLIENGANINAIDYSGDTPLHEAVNELNIETVCMLLYYNADANIPNVNNITPFMYALLHSNVELQDILFEFVDDFNTVTSDGMSIFALALSHDSPYLEEIVNRGADINFHSDAYHPVYLCLTLDSNPDKFKLIWNNYKGISHRDFDELSAFSFILSDHLQDYINIIIDSGNFDPIANNPKSVHGFNSFMTYCADNNISLDMITKLTCCFLCSGYQPSISNFQTIFYRFGYCELCKIMVHIDFSILDTRLDMNYLSLSQIICDVRKPVSCYMDQLTDFTTENRIDNIILHYADEFDIPTLLQYVVYPKFMSQLRILINNNPESENLKMLKRKIDMLPSVPSLLELARNKTREYIVNKFEFNRSSQYYTYLNHVNLSTTYKKILSFEKPLYGVRPFYIRNHTDV